MKEMKRVLALVLCFVMLVGYLPAGALAAESETVLPAVEAVLGEGVSTWKPQEEQDATEPATEEFVETATEAPEELGSFDSDAAQTPEEDAAVSEEDIADALIEAEAFVKGLMDSNDPQTVVEDEGSFFDWDYEMRKSPAKSYLYEWSYYNGVVFEGLDYLYDVTGEKEYSAYVEEYLDAMITDGALNSYAGYVDYHGADCYKTASLLLDYYALTGNEEYKTAADALYTHLQNAKAKYTSSDIGGNYYHTWKSVPAYHLWLDGLYMILPFMAEYAAAYDKAELDLIAARLAWVSENMYDAETGLFSHAINLNKAAYNNSGKFWGRAIGWYAAALVDVMDHMEGQNLADMKAQLKKLVDGMIPYQTDDGMWRQFVNVASSTKETSVTALMGYAIMKAVNEGWLAASYAEYANKAFVGICDYALDSEGLHYICHKGSTSGYSGVYKTMYVNEGKGVGPFLMFYAEMEESIYGAAETVPVVTGLTVSGKDAYVVGDTFVNPTVVASYSNGTVAEVSEFTVTGAPDMTAAGTFTVTVEFGGKTAEYTVTVAELLPVSVELPNGDTLTAWGDGLTAISGVWDETNQYTDVFETNLSYGAYHVTLEGLTEGKTARLTMSVYGVKTENLVVYAVAEDGTRTEITPVTAKQNEEYPEYLDVTFEVAGSGTYACGTRFEGIPEDAVLQEITIAQAPAKVKYFLEQVNAEGILPLDITDLKVTATYANETETVTKDIFWNEFGKKEGYGLTVDMTVLGEQDVVISYTWGNVTKTVSYGITIYDKNVPSDNADVQIELTVPGVTAVSATVKTFENYVVNAVDVLMADYVAYDIVLTGYNQGESVSVTLPLPEGEGEAMVYHIPTDGMPPVQMQDVTDNGNGTVTFTTDHFSTYASGRAISSVTGSTTINNNNTADTPSDQNGVSQLTSGAYYRLYNTRANAYLSGAASGAKLARAGNDPVYWYITHVSGNSYYVQLGGPNGPYLHIGENTAAVNSTANALTLQYNGSTWTLAQNNQWLNDHGGAFAGWREADAGSQWEFNLIASRTYTLDTDGMDPGAKYLIVGDTENIALNLANGTVGQRNVTVSNNQITVVGNVAQSEFYFNPNSTENGSPVYLLTQDGSNTVYHASGVMYYGKDNKGHWHVVTGSNGQYRVYDTDNNSNWHLNYGVAWAANSVDRFSVSSNQQSVRLYKYEAPTSEGGDEITFTVTPGEIGIVEGRMYVLAPKVTFAGVATDDYTISWSIADTGTATINSVGVVQGVKQGTTVATATLKKVNGITLANPIALNIRVTVVPTTINRILPDTASGVVYVNSTGTTRTGSTLQVTYGSGVTLNVAVTLNMLRDANGNAVKADAIGVQEGLKIVYDGKEYSPYTLRVVARPNEDHPDYPNPGSVAITKNAMDVSQFQNVGVAEIQLTAAGIPMKSNVDVLLVLDLSNSMAWEAGSSSDADTFEDTKLRSLQRSVTEFTDILLKPTEDGSPISNTMSVVTFGGIDLDHTRDTGTVDNYDEMADVTQTLVDFTNNPAYVKGTVNNLRLLGDSSYPDHYKLSFDGGETYYNNFGNTNYDYAFMQAYESINTFKNRYYINYGQTYEQSGRNMYVLFMTDGAPTHYDGRYYNYGSANRIDMHATWWANAATKEEVSYNSGNGSGGKVSNAAWYQHIAGGTYQNGSIPGNSLYWADQVANTAGVKEIISIGFDIAHGGFSKYTFNESDGRPLFNVLQKLVNGKTLRTYTSEDEAGLTEVYRNLATEIVQAATESYFVDQMGGSFDIETRPHITKFVDEAPQYTVGLNPVPKITISVYDTYKSSQVGTVVNGNLVTGDMVGKTYGTPEVLETVYFDPTGTKAYSSAIDARADGLVNAVDENGKVLKDANDQIVQVTKYTGTNIWGTDNVIRGKYFYYNAGENAVTIDEPGNRTDPSSNGSTYTLEPETFRWNIGTIQEKKFVMSYYVALEGAAGGTANAGTYETNTYATLYYKNYLGHEVGKYVQTPVLAWDSMSVRYGFYLVDSQGRPVADRSTGTLAHNFANAARVTEVAPFDTIKLNSTGAVSLNLDTTKILPEGYKLYDPDAKYQVYIDSVGAGSGWDITTGEGKVESTYVTHYRGDEYTNKDSSTLSTEDGMISYSDTIVWFAVLWEPRAVPDVIVIDYGLPVDIDVMFNDMFGTRGSLLGISSLGNVPTAEKDGQTVSLLDTSMWKNVSSAAFGDSYDDAAEADDSLEFGDISIVDGLVRYTPRTMQMPTYDKFAYEALFNNTDATTGKPNQEYYYGSVTVIPATTIYYEDTYVEMGANGNSEYRFFDLASYTRAAEYGGRQKGTDENGNAIEYAVNKAGEKIESAEFKDANGNNKVYPIDKFGFALDANGNRMADNANAWGIDGATDSGTQGQDRPGSLNNAKIDVNNIYGYDGAYENYSNHSLGSARKIHIEPGKYGTATFSFWGTGFDIVSMTTNKTGTMAVEVYEYGTDNYMGSLAVDTYYGYDIGWRDVTYTYTENGWVQTDVGETTNLNNVQSVPEGKTRNLPPNPAVGETATIAELHWVLNNGKNNALYQVPVLEIEKLPYGHYTAVLTASYYESLDHTTDSGYDLYLDAIRIYDPAGTQYGTDDNADPATGNLIDSVIQNAYKADTEAWPVYMELRNILIGKNDFNGMVAGEQITGAMFIDQQSSSFFSVENYKNYGPNNELYLTEGQSIAFTLDFSNLTKIVEDTIVNPNGSTTVVQNKKNIVADVQIGLKSANGGTVAVELGTYTRGDTDAEGAHSVRKSIAQITGTQSSTDRYYSIGKHVIRDSSCALSLKNNGGGILSVTNIKITFSEDPYSTSNGDIEEMIVVNKEDGDKILDILSLDAANKAGKAPAQQPDAELEVNVRKSTVAQGDTVVVKTTTSEDVAAVTVDGVKVEKFVQNTQTGKRSWTATVKAETAGNQKIEVVAYNAKGQVLETATVTLEVTEEKAGVVQSAVGNIVSRLFS